VSLSLRAVGLALGALVLSVGPVLADTELGHKGKVGAHDVRDSALDPVVRCYYSATTNKLKTFEVDGPYIFARDRTPEIDTQQVGWQVIIKRQFESEDVTTFFKSSVRRAQSWDDAAPKFASRTFDLKIPAEPFGYYSRYWVVQKMIWYRGDGSVAGSAQHRIDNYERHRGTDTTAASWCFHQWAVI